MIKAKKTTEKVATKKVVKKTDDTAAVPKKTVEKKLIKKVIVKKAVTKEVAQKETVKAVLATPEKKIVKKAVVSAAPVKKGATVINPNIGGVGRRKSSVARVWLGRGKGGIVINGRKIDNYFDTTQTRINAIKALEVCNAVDKFTIKVTIAGGGPCSQSDAVKLGIARALLKSDENNRTILREHGLLTVDARVKERKKPGQPGARRKFQFVKR